MGVSSNEPTVPLTHHVGTAAERHEVSRCSIQFCGMKWHPDQPGNFGQPEPESRFEIQKPCEHRESDGEVRDELIGQHLVYCLNPLQRQGYIRGLQEMAKIGNQCVHDDHLLALEHLGTEAGVDDAIRASHRADGNDGLITGWIVLASVSQFDDDGTDRSGVHRMFPDGSMPWVQCLGIIEAARIQMQRDYANGEA